MVAEETSGPERERWPGESLYETGRKLLMAAFFVIFLLIAHQKFYGGYLRSKGKLIVLMCVAPFVIGGGLCCLVGWWQMKLAGAFEGPLADVVEAERKQRKRRHEEENLLPWQRRS